MQARIKDLNDLAFYVPRVDHSLNLVEDCSAKSCLEAIIFFNSPKIISILCGFNSSEERLLRRRKSNKTLKSLSSARWTCCDDAIEAVADDYGGMYDVLTEISQDENESPDTRHEANSLKNKLTKLETGFMTVFWQRVLKRFNATSVYLQRVEIDLVTANDMLKSFITFTYELQEDFEAIEGRHSTWNIQKIDFSFFALIYSYTIRKYNPEV